ncbi:MAG: LysR family transcriptional regulator [Polyangiaceae bacterium]
MNDLLALRLFCRVVERGSFSAVAREEGVSQPNVSRRVAQLERDLQAQLLTRTTRKVALTDAGRAFYERVRPALRHLTEAEADLRSGVSAVAGSVRVAAPGAFGQRFVVPALLDLMREHAGLQVQLLLNDASVDLIGEAIDVAVRIASGAPSSFKQRRIGEARQVVVASERYLRRAGTPTQMGDLAAHAWVLARTTLAAMDAARGTSAFSQLPVIVPRFLCDDIQAVSEAVRADLGLSVLPRWMVSEELESGKLLQLWPELALPGAPILALFASTRVPVRIRAVVDAIAARVASDPATRREP